MQIWNKKQNFYQNLNDPKLLSMLEIRLPKFKTQIKSALVSLGH